MDRFFSATLADSIRNRTRARTRMCMCVCVCVCVFLRVYLSQHHGSTDVNVIVDVMKHRGLDEGAVLDKIEQAKSVMVEYVQSHSSQASKGLDVLPGVPELLQALRDRNVKVGLVRVVEGEERRRGGRCNRICIESIYLSIYLLSCVPLSRFRSPATCRPSPGPRWKLWASRACFPSPCSAGLGRTTGRGPSS